MRSSPRPRPTSRHAPRHRPYPDADAQSEDRFNAKPLPTNPRDGQPSRPIPYRLSNCFRPAAGVVIAICRRLAFHLGRENCVRPDRPSFRRTTRDDLATRGRRGQQSVGKDWNDGSAEQGRAGDGPGRAGPGRNAAGAIQSQRDLAGSRAVDKMRKRAQTDRRI